MLNETKLFHLIRHIFCPFLPFRTVLKQMRIVPDLFDACGTGTDDDVNIKIPKSFYFDE